MVGFSFFPSICEFLIFSSNSDTEFIFLNEQRWSLYGLKNYQLYIFPSTIFPTIKLQTSTLITIKNSVKDYHSN